MPDPVELADKNFRVRQIAITMNLDVYDDAGVLVERPTTNPIVLNEAQFPPVLVDYLTMATNLGRGFVRATAPVAPGNGNTLKPGEMVAPPTPPAATS